MLGVLLFFATGAPAFAGAVDAGFENGAEGAALASPAVGRVRRPPTPPSTTTRRAKVGLQSGWIQGPTVAASAGASRPEATDLRRRRGPVLAYFDDTTNAHRRESPPIRQRRPRPSCARSPTPPCQVNTQGAPPTATPHRLHPSGHLHDGLDRVPAGP